MVVGLWNAQSSIYGERACPRLHFASTLKACPCASAAQYVAVPQTKSTNGLFGRGNHAKTPEVRCGDTQR